MTPHIRPERVSEHREIENLVRDAFWNLYVPGAFPENPHSGGTEFVPLENQYS